MVKKLLQGKGIIVLIALVVIIGIYITVKYLHRQEAIKQAEYMVEMREDDFNPQKTNFTNIKANKSGSEWTVTGNITYPFPDANSPLQYDHFKIVVIKTNGDWGRLYIHVSN